MMQKVISKEMIYILLQINKLFYHLNLIMEAQTYSTIMQEMRE